MARKEPLLWASLVRIVATAIIFIFHFRGMTGLYVSHIDYWGISMFLFISGWFAFDTKSSPQHWLFKRVQRIMVPYWGVISIVLLVNHVIDYKETSLFHDVLIFFGMSMFLEDPVYVISWFITMILLFYLSVFLKRLIKSDLLKVIYLLCSLIVFNKLLGVMFLYFIVFYAGYYLHDLSVRFNWQSKGFSGCKWCLRLNEGLFRIQNYSYSFFLVHGGVLIFIVKFRRMEGSLAFVLALALSMIVAVVHNRLLRRWS